MDNIGAANLKKNIYVIYTFFSFAEISFLFLLKATAANGLRTIVTPDIRSPIVTCAYAAPLPTPTQYAISQYQNASDSPVETRKNNSV